MNCNGTSSTSMKLLANPLALDQQTRQLSSAQLPSLVAYHTGERQPLRNLGGPPKQTANISIEELNQRLYYNQMKPSTKREESNESTNKK